MSTDDYEWDYWPPRGCYEDPVVVESVLKFIESPNFFVFHRSAWESIMNSGALGDFRVHSGNVSQPFIDRAVACSFNPFTLGTELLGESVRNELLINQVERVEMSPMNLDDEDLVELEDMMQAEVEADQLYKGCLWELTIMFASQLVSIVFSSDESVPLSSRDPISRKEYIQRFIKIESIKY